MSDISSIKLPDNSSYNVKAKKIFYAECSTAKSDVAKVVTCSGFVLEAGAMIAIRFTDTTTTTPKSGNITLNINNTGAKNIVPKGNNSVFSYGWSWAFCNNQTWLFMYNGTYFVCMNQDNNTTYNDATTSAHGLLSVADKKALDVLKTPYATCATARSTAAKVATLANFTLAIGTTIAVKFTATDTSNPSSGNLTLNVNSTGAKTIGYFKNGSKAALNYSSAAYFYNNFTHIFTYDGTYWLCMDWNADTNTDTKVTSVGNHYTPAKSTTKSASGGTLTDITNSKSGTQVVTGVEMDAKGHVTGVTSVALKSTDTKVTVDSALSSTSTNPVQNKAVYTALAGKAASSHTHSDYALKSKYGDTTINVGRKTGTNVGEYSTAEGYSTTASRSSSHAEGWQTIASGGYSHSEGNDTTASGVSSHSEGNQTTASNEGSHAEGFKTTASGRFSHTEGSCTTARGDDSHAEGYNTTASGAYSHAEGYSDNSLSSVITDFSSETTRDDIISAWTDKKFSLAKGDYSHSEGVSTLALVPAAHAEGHSTTASGYYSHAEGQGTTASGYASHAEGQSTTASGYASHAEGQGTTASSQYSHAGGCGATASGSSSFSHGYYTTTTHDNEAAYGKYNESNNNTLFSIGNGTADDARHNAFEITTTGGKLHNKDIATTDLIPNSHDFLGKDYVYPTFVNYGFGADLNNYVTEYHGFIFNCENSPIAHDYGFLDVSFFDGTGFAPSTPDKGGVVLQKFSRTDNCVFTRMRVANVWSKWKEISTTPIKSTPYSSTTNDNSMCSLWASSENKIPIAVILTNMLATIFYSGSGLYAFTVQQPDTHLYKPNIQVSGTVYYIEI